MISFFRAPIRNITPQAQVTVQQIYKYITSDYAKLVTERLRSIADHGEARKYKAEMFDYVTFSGHFKTRQTSGLIEHSGFLCFDIDKIESEDDLQNIKAQLITDEKLHTVLLFRSPSGNGLKWVVEVPDRYWLCQCQQSINGRLQITDDSYIDTVTKNHKLLYERIREYLLDEYGIVTDHTSDIPRPCYLPYDDDAFYDEPTFRANPAHPFLADARSTVDIFRYAQDFCSAQQSEQAQLPSLIAKSQQSMVYRPLRPADINSVEIAHTRHSSSKLGSALVDSQFSPNSGEELDRRTALNNDCTDLGEELADTACRVPTRGDSKRGCYDDTEAVVREIEKRRIDITGDYLNWIRIAFAIASKHGAPGEGYFHRISQFHHGYDHKEAHKVYLSCLRNNSGAVTIATIVYLMRSEE